MASVALTTIHSTSRDALRARAASLRQAAARLIRPAPVRLDPHLALRDDLLKAYDAVQAARPIFEIEGMEGSDEYRAALALERRFLGVIREILRLPPPSTMDGLVVVGLAAALHAEGDVSGGMTLDNAPELVAVIKALRHVIPLNLPATFLGFGDEPGFDERRRAATARRWALPA